MDGKGPPWQDEVSSLLEREVMGAVIRFLEETGSTNEDAAALARAGAPEGSVVAAERQRAGRGRQGRSWHSPGGENLYFSVVLRPDVESARVPQLALVAAASVHRALAELCPDLPAAVKWPNDILISGRKVAGILCEAKSEGGRAAYAVAGVGINVNTRSFPPPLDEVATSLALEGGRPIPRAPLLAGILLNLEKFYRRWLAASDLSGIDTYLEEHSFLTGRRVSVTEGGRTLEGSVLGIGSRGELVLRSASGGIRKVTAGSVTLLD